MFDVYHSFFLSLAWTTDWGYYWFVYWEITWAENCDFSGSDIDNAPTRTKKQECANVCWANDKCSHFTWGGGNCWLKKWTGINTPSINYGNTRCGFIPGRFIGNI